MRFCGGINRKLALEALEVVGLAERASHRPTELSGGEQQRVAIARAIVKKPPFLLADEPTGNLDSKSGAEIINILKRLHAEQQMTMVMITHDRTIAEHCQRIINLKDGMVIEE
jgi:putative ABC transport system ATP-binding protein